MTERTPAARAALPLALVSLVALALEVLLTRVLSYSVHTLLLYAVLGVALLGFGIAGTIVALVPRWLEADRLPRVLAWIGAGSVHALVLSFAVFVRITASLRSVDAFTFLGAALLTLPFLAIGLVITLVLAASGSEVGRAYAA
ncbi:MAG TPA: hypothetical protein VHM19_11755, partial [Polyangiales bacterium]|nr:hypothetical protein [Polyangiales bacterium]